MLYLVLVRKSFRRMIAYRAATLAGLVTSTLLKLQYHVLDASAAQLVTRLSVLVDVRLKRVF